MRAMVAPVLTAASTLLLTGALRRRDLCVYRPLTGVSRLRTSTAASRVNAGESRPRIRFRSAPGREAGGQEWPRCHRSGGGAHDWRRPADLPDDAGRPL